MPGSPIYFITQCASQRGLNQLCLPNVSRNIFAATEHYQNQLRWHVHLLLLMPDHLHALISFPRAESMQQVVRAWKHYLSNKHNIEWQRDFFDHRLRSDEAISKKSPTFAIILYAPASLKHPASGHMFGRLCRDSLGAEARTDRHVLTGWVTLSPHRIGDSSKVLCLGKSIRGRISVGDLCGNGCGTKLGCRSNAGGGK